LPRLWRGLRHRIVAGLAAVIWDLTPRSLRAPPAFVAGLARLAALTRLNLSLSFRIPLTPNVFGSLSGVSRSAMPERAPRAGAPLTWADEPQTLLAPVVEPSMDAPSPPPTETLTPANDGPPISEKGQAALMTLARLIGRQIAREEFARRMAAANAETDDNPA
jgi:hypothetical protein